MSPKNLTRAVIPAIDLYCRKANFKTLKFLSMILGSKKDWYDNTKAPVRNFLVSRCAIFEQLRTHLIDEGKVSLFGIFLTNDSFSFCKMIVDDKFNTSLINWRKIAFDYTFVTERRQHISLLPTDTLFATEKIISLLGVSPNMANLVSIERQRTALMDFSCKLKLNILEHLLYAKCQGVQATSTDEKARLLASICNPEFIDSFWCELTPIRASLKENPSISVPQEYQIYDPVIRATIKEVVAKRLLRSAFDNDIDPLMRLHLDKGWKLKFPTLSSTSDLSFSLKDCLSLDTGRDTSDMTEVFLSTMASSETLRTYSNLVDIVMKDNGRFNSDILKQFNDYVKQEKLNLQNFQAGSSEFLKNVNV
ncbi:hypothetical protein SMKI_09G1870 [Saccharomyces mikatae IFO 1815]|uniref:Mitochondrial resolvase Ydc2 catalytic domain-containing protein n=1 Tax=Saccharomyces mikatae IFO 1815 TaxID=226126 RepID=A0AA35IZG1_SACMI|nr:uncharacterized protein SMKI_09G1870 [Saccharomyces mikatae IFO 1815]CAI4039776.1 hypothetical protein SMKI_09G1870 [Saccharomyces mikatae IFO 1815]